MTPLSENGIKVCITHSNTRLVKTMGIPFNIYTCPLCGYSEFYSCTIEKKTSDTIKELIPFGAELEE